MRKLLQYFYHRKRVKHGKHFSLGYDRGYEDGRKEGYERGRLSLYGVLNRVTTLEARIERLDKLLTELRTKGAGAEHEKTTAKMA